MNRTRQALLIWQILLLITSNCTWAQSWEFKANAYTGLFSFRGNHASAVAKVYLIERLGFNNGMNFSTKSSFSYSAEVQAQKFFESKFLFGLGIGFEQLKCQQRIDTIYSIIGGNTAAEGNTTLRFSFITIHPYFGKRFWLGPVDLDITAGLDIGINCAVLQKANLPTINRNYEGRNQRYNPDFRPRVQATATVGRIGIAVAYSHGLTDYEDNKDPFSNFNYEAYSRYLRAGISYKMR